MSIMQRLYNSEINCTIATFWDGGFSWSLGDCMNGIKAEGTSDSFDDAERNLALAAVAYYPESAFAKDYAAG